MKNTLENNLELIKKQVLELKQNQLIEINYIAIRKDRHDSYSLLEKNIESQYYLVYENMTFEVAVEALLLETEEE